MTPPSAPRRDLRRRERELRREGFRRIAGTDEAGAGPLAGPLVAAAVILPAERRFVGLDDSKRLPPARRERLARAIEQHAVALAVAVVPAAVVDRIGPFAASVRAMTCAVLALDPCPDFVLADARRLPGLGIPHEAPVGGDGLHRCIAAASIVAKVRRDAMMRALDRCWPGYGFARHKGYGTPEHLAALARLGPCSQHRRRWAPVRAVVEPRLPLGEP
ncbi:MAG: hypothetical protein Kow0062_12090 [Acidobacteriota bacterium]|nr:MAG: ribonuclease HII [Acidobacteriota bacterium]